MRRSLIALSAKKLHHAQVGESLQALSHPDLLPIDYEDGEAVMQWALPAVKLYREC